MNKSNIGFIVIITLLVLTSALSLNMFFRQRSDHDILDINTFPHKIDGWVAMFWPELGILKRDTVDEWWESRKGRSLHELEIEALEHAIKETNKKKWDSKEDREYVLDRLLNAMKSMKEEEGQGNPDVFDVKK